MTFGYTLISIGYGALHLVLLCALFYYATISKDSRDSPTFDGKFVRNTALLYGLTQTAQSVLCAVYLYSFHH